MKKWCLILFFSLLINCCFSQQSFIDSLIKESAKPLNDTNKSNNLNYLVRAYIDIGSFDSAIAVGKQCEAFISNRLQSTKEIKTLHALKSRMADCYINFGILAEFKENFVEANNYYSKALKISKENSDKRKMADAYTNIGVMQDAQGLMSESIKNYFTALRLYEEIGDKGGIAAAYNNIAYVYSEQDNFEMALKYDLLSLKIEEERNNKSGISNSYLSIGIIYQNTQKYTEALEIYNKALIMLKELENKEGLANAFNNMGVVYANRGLSEKNELGRSNDLDQALSSHLMALKIREEMNYTSGICSSFTNIGYVYTKLKNYSEAKRYLDKSIELGSSISSRYNLKYAYYYRSELDSLLGDFKTSCADYKMHIVYRDSLINEETRKKTIQNQMSFDFEKKEAIAQAEHRLELQNQSKQAEEQDKKQKLIITFIAIGLILVAAFAVYVFRSLRITSKQKQIIETQKQIVEEKHKEINDSINYAERIQRSFLATKDLLNQHLKEYFVFFQPKDVVSGDFYWAASDTNGKLFYLCTADSTGHGVPGAIMSILNISSLERAIEHGLTNPAEILNHTRNTIIERLKKDGSEEGGKDGMDASLICFDFEQNKFTYACANNPIWVIRNKELIELLPDKMPVGKHDKDQQSFSIKEFDVIPNDLVYTLTDGLPDQFGGPKGKKFMYKRLKELLITVSHEPILVQKEKIITEFENWKLGIEQIDDVTLIGIKI